MEATIKNQVRLSFGILLVISILHVSIQFKCERDGLFEDEDDCKMYYECLWMGTQFEKVEHLKCADGLMYNPMKHRCDEISEFELQFGNGIHSPNDLVQYIRFRNCLDEMNVEITTTTTTTIPTSLSPIVTTTPLPLTDRKVVEIIQKNNVTTNTGFNTTTSMPIETIHTTEELPQQPQQKQYYYFIPKSKYMNFNENEIAKFDNHNNNEIVVNNNIIKDENSIINKTSSINETNPSYFVNIKASKVAMNITGYNNESLFDIKSGIHNAIKQPIETNDNKFLKHKFVNNDPIVYTPESDEHIQIKHSAIPPEDSVYVMEDEKVYFGKKVYLESQGNKKKQKSIVSSRLAASDDSKEDRTSESNEEKHTTEPRDPSDLATHMSVMKIFIRRRVLKTTTAGIAGISKHQNNSTNDDVRIYLNDDRTGLPETNEFVRNMIVNKQPYDYNNVKKNYNHHQRSLNSTNELNTTTYSGETSIDENHDDEFIKRAKNRHHVKVVPIPTFYKRKILSIDDFENDVSVTKNPNENNVIDKIEQRLTKRVHDANDLANINLIQQINNNLLSASTTTKDKKSTTTINTPLTTNTTTTTNTTAGTTSSETTTTTTTKRSKKSSKNGDKNNFDKFLRMNNMNATYFNQTMIGRKPLKFVKMLKKSNLTTRDSSEMSDSDLDRLPQTIKPLFIKPNQTNFITLMPRTNTKKVDLSEFDTQTNRSKISKKMRVFHLKPINLNNTLANFTSFTVSDSTVSPKYFYPFNELKGKGNFSNETRKQMESLVLLDNSNYTRISEVEKGGQFQRMFLQPADALIECKDNDFGLECSCSVTLSPPKCKQLINSFLSSCRIVGCQNNGRCINMAYKYPIPYVCSCPASHMGSYCEIPRNNEDNVNKYFNVNNPIIKTKRPTLPPYPSTKLGGNDFKEPICQPSPCLNNGICEIVAETIHCICINASFTGKFCERYIVPTTPSPPPTEAPKINNLIPLDNINHWNCPSNCNRDKYQGRCVLSILGYPKCACEIGWSGSDCNQRNYCAYNDCLNNATCSNLPFLRSYICLCSKGFSGRRCEVMATNFFQQQQVVPYNYPTSNPCGSVTCQNNGTCLMSFSHEKNQFSFICKCKLGYRGVLCEIKASDCDYKSCPLIEDPMLKSRNMVDNLTEIATTQSPKTDEMAKILEISNPCRNDPELCYKYQYGNDSFTCLRSLVTQAYTLCLPIESIHCTDKNPCLNGGKCVNRTIQDSKTSEIRKSWKCVCNENYTGSLCETEVCTNVHKTIANHTMCQPNSINYKSGGLEPIDIELILDMHNSLRRQVLPSASNMQKVYWDVRLQHLAQKRSQLCTIETDSVSMRQLPGYGIVIGENLAAGYDSWAHVLSSWIGESKFFTYDSEESKDNSKAGHYTQMIYSAASRIGCGYAECSQTSYERYFVCYYAEMQTYQSRYKPYISGNTCSTCQNNCNEGLCDCKGVYCSNGGSLDLNTCTCKCQHPAFTGDFCEKVTCPKEDSQFCSTALFKDKCWLYPVVRASCPYMCHICGKNNDLYNATMQFSSTPSVKSFLTTLPTQDAKKSSETHDHAI